MVLCLAAPLAPPVKNSSLSLAYQICKYNVVGTSPVRSVWRPMSKVRKAKLLNARWKLEL